MTTPPDRTIIVNSCSGGKTSSYMYLKFPSEKTIFAVVLSGHESNKIRDPGVLREVQKRIPWAEGSMELEQTLKAMLDLEEIGGREITWVAASFTYEDLIFGNSGIPGKRFPALPNGRQRFCTQELKLYPIFYHCFGFWMSEGDILMNIGFRADEPQRVKKYDKGCGLSKISYPFACNVKNRRWLWEKDFYWRDVNFPLYHFGVTKEDVAREIEKTGIVYPEISNCAYCFFHTATEHRKQYSLNPEQLESWVEMEDRVSINYLRRHTFNGDYSLEEIIDGRETEALVSGCMCTD